MNYSILYLKTDVCHLADVFQKFRNFCFETYELDCRYSYTLPGYSWQCMLKMTKIELDLISNQDMYLFLMDSIRGSITQVNKKYSKAVNTELRKKAKNDLEKDLFKLMNNAIFGKSMENVLNKSNIKLINNDPEKLLRLIKQPNFEHIHKISDKQVLVQSKRIKTKFNKPIYLGSVILETSILYMYKFWYDYLKVKYVDNINLIYTDTDSFVLEIFTDDVYKDIKNVNHLFDFSEYPKDHKYYNVKNEKKLGIFKDELHGKIMTEFSCLKPKIYSFEFIENNSIKNNKKHKGIKKSVDIYHNDYKNVFIMRKFYIKNFIIYN